MTDTALLAAAAQAIAALGGPADLAPGHLSETRFVWRAWELAGLGRGIAAQAHQGFTAVVWLAPGADRIVCRIQPLPHGFGFGLAPQASAEWSELKRLDEAQLFPATSQLVLVHNAETGTFEIERAVLFGRASERTALAESLFRLCNLSSHLTAAELSDSMVALLAGSLLHPAALPAAPSRSQRSADVTPLRRGLRLAPVPATAPGGMLAALAA